MRSWLAAILVLTTPVATAQDAAPTREDVMALANDPNIQLKMDKLVQAVNASSFDWSAKDVYVLVDLDLPPEVLKPAAAKAGIFWDGTAQSMRSLHAKHQSRAPAETIRITSNDDFVILFEFFNDIKNALTLAEQQAGTLVPRMDHETDDAWFLRERKHQEDLVAARSPVHARIAATTFEIEIHGGFTPYDGSCTQGTVSIDLCPVDFGLYRYALGGRRVDLPLSLDADNVQTAQFKASGSRVFEATSTPVCVSESAAASLTEAGSTLSVTLRRPPDSDQWTGSAEFKNAKTGAKL